MKSYSTRVTGVREAENFWAIYRMCNGPRKQIFLSSASTSHPWGSVSPKWPRWTLSRCSSTIVFMYYLDEVEELHRDGLLIAVSWLCHHNGRLVGSPSRRNPQILGNKKAFGDLSQYSLLAGTSLCLEDTETSQYADLKTRRGCIRWNCWFVQEKIQIFRSTLAMDTGRLLSFLKLDRALQIIDDVEEWQKS